MPMTLYNKDKNFSLLFSLYVYLLVSEPLEALHFETTQTLQSIQSLQFFYNEFTCCQLATFSTPKYNSICCILLVSTLYFIPAIKSSLLNFQCTQANIHKVLSPYLTGFVECTLQKVISEVALINNGGGWGVLANELTLSIIYNLALVLKTASYSLTSYSRELLKYECSESWKE